MKLSLDTIKALRALSSNEDSVDAIMLKLNGGTTLNECYDVVNALDMDYTALDIYDYAITEFIAFNDEGMPLVEFDLFLNDDSYNYDERLKHLIWLCDNTMDFLDNHTNEIIIDIEYTF